MSVVTASIHIAAPPSAVWRLVMDPHSLGDWVSIHRKLIRADDGPPRVGFQMDQQVHLRGVSLEVRWELVACQEERQALWRGSGPARSGAQTEYQLAGESGGTRFDYRNEFRAPLGPIGALASRALVGGIPEREARRTLEALRERLESQPQPARQR